MMERNIKRHKCLYFSYQRYCTKDFYKDLKKFGWADLTEYKCSGVCKHFKKKTLFNRLVWWLFR